MKTINSAGSCTCAASEMHRRSRFGAGTRGRLGPEVGATRPLRVVVPVVIEQWLYRGDIGVTSQLMGYSVFFDKGYKWIEVIYIPTNNKYRGL